MKTTYYVSVLAGLLIFFSTNTNAQKLAFDVIHYDAEVEPDIASKTVRGNVVLRITTSPPVNSHAKRPTGYKSHVYQMELDCGQLVIDSVSEGKMSLKFELADNHLRVFIPLSQIKVRNIAIAYHGTPRRGIRFFPEQGQVYTVFSTSQWLPCVDAPHDKATLRMRLILPRAWTAVANGTLLRKIPSSSRKMVHEWLQDKPIPTYTFGFAAGRFLVISERPGRPKLRYLDPIIAKGPNSSHPITGL